MLSFSRVGLVAWLILLSGRWASAGSLTLEAQDLVWNRPVDGPTSHTLSITLDHAASPPDSDRLVGWQVRLQLVPISATGTLFFHSGAQPSGYLLDGVSGGFSASPSGTSLFAFDEDQTTVGVIVPTTNGKLLDLTFETPNNAVGTFSLLAIPGLAQTQWSDSNFQDREFANVPLAALDPIALATITVVPEPASLGLLAVGMSALGLAARARCQRRRSNATMVAAEDRSGCGCS